MADQKITDLVELTGVDVSDVLPVVDDALGSPETKKCTAQNLVKGGAFGGACSGVVDSNLTADRVVVTDSGGKLTNSGITTTELDYLDGVTSNIQDQLDNPGGGDSDALKNHAKGQVVSNIYDICSSVDNLKGLWIFDQDGADTAVVDRGPQGHNAVLSANGSTLNPDYAGLCPYLDLTSSAYFEIADHNDFSFGDGSTDEAFSVVALINPNAANFGDILSKYDLTTGATNYEYRLASAYDKLYLEFYDNSSYGNLTRNCDCAFTVGEWIAVVATYSGAGSVSGVSLYKDGVEFASYTDYGSNYTAMENTNAVLGNFHKNTSGAKIGFGDYKAGVLAVIKEELSAAKVKQISQTLLAYAGNL